MLDNLSVDQLIVEQIKTAVDQRVGAIMDMSDWTAQLESKIIETVQARINGKFANVSVVPELVELVQTNIDRMFSEGRVPGLGEFVEQQKVTHAVDSAVQALVTETIANLSVDADWLEKIQTIVNQTMVQQVLKQLSMIDINSAVAAAVRKNFDNWKAELEDIVLMNGIVDQSKSRQLTVMEGVVVAENELVANSLSVVTQAEIKGDLVVNNLIVKGAVNTDNNSWDELAGLVGAATLEKITPEWQDQLIQQVLESARTQGIDFESITINGTPLVNGNSLNKSITQTNITNLGELERLAVKGPAQINDTFNVLNRRVGINTADPEMALSVWDEDVAVVVGKFSKQHGYIGTARAQSLSIGVNRTPQIEIDTDGLTTIKQLRIGQHRIGFAREVPGYSGTRGDIVFNLDPKPNSPFAWQCLGSFQWQPINFTTTS